MNNYVNAKKSFSELMMEKGINMLTVVSIITFTTVLLIKLNNTVVNSLETKGALISYWVAFIIFLVLLCIGTAILTKYGMDLYPFYQQPDDEIEEAEEDSGNISNITKTPVSSGLAPIETITNPKASSNVVVPTAIVATAVATPIIAEVGNNNAEQEDIICGMTTNDESIDEYDTLWEEGESFILPD